MIYYVGGTSREFENYCRDRGINPRRDAMHFRRAQHVQGRRIRPEDEILYSSAYSNISMDESDALHQAINIARYAGGSK